MKRFLSVIITISMVISLIGGITVFGEEKPFYNESFENGLGEWTYATSTSEPYVDFAEGTASDGKKSIHINDNSTDAGPGVKSPFINITAGKTYTVAGDIKAISGTGVKLFVKFYDGNKKNIFTENVAAKGGDWSVVKWCKNAPEGAVYMEVLFCGVKASMGEIYADNLRVYEGDVAVSAPSSAITAEGVGASKPSTEAPSTEVAPLDDGRKDGDIMNVQSFENGLGDWVMATSTSSTFVTPTSLKASDGKCSVHINDTSDEAGPGIQSPMLTASAGNRYSVAVDTLSESGSVSVYLRFYDVKEKALHTKSIKIGSVGSWDVTTVSEVAPEGTAYLRVLICGLKANFGEVYVDNARIQKGVINVKKPEVPFVAPSQVKTVNSQIVAPVNNKLQYNTYNEEGDKLSDYSYGGFAAGEYNLPVSSELPVVATLSPSGTKDDTALIQNAINKVYDEATDDRMKIIRLKAGKYYINKQGINLKSGIILSGEGQGPEGTILYAKDAVQHVPVKLAGVTPSAITQNANITDEYVKAGSKKFNIDSEKVKDYKVGDLIAIVHPSTAEWITAMEMIDIVNVYNDNNSWKPGEVDVLTERTITAIKGTEITVDFPLFMPLNKKYSQSYINKISDYGKIVNAGIENLRIESYYNGDPEDENHATNAIMITNAKDCFLRDVTAKHFYGSLVCSGKRAKQISVINCSSIDPVSTVTGSRRYSFSCSTSAQQLLYTGCYSYDGRHDFEASSTVTGPIAFVDNLVDKSNNSTETHGTWSTGVLYDNIYEIAQNSIGFIAFANRGIYGTRLSQGWCAGSTMAWNCLATAIIAHKPPLSYQNFIVGAWGVYNDPAGKNMKSANIEKYKKIYRKTSSFTATEENFATKDGTSFVGDVYKEAEFNPVEPRSIYKAQLSERFTGVITNAKPNSPIIVSPKYDKTSEDKSLTVTGVYQLGAEKVTVYIDNVPYNATLKSEDNTFELKKELEKGTHKIFATQTIGGVEGNKTADRFFTIGASNGNPEYLQSIYSPEMMSMLKNDTRPTYDVYEKSIAKELSNEITVTVDGFKLESDVKPLKKNDRVLVPMRAIFEKLGATVEWDEKTLTATAYNDTAKVKITENQTVAYVNDKPVTLDVPAQIINGRFVVPVRFISESFGAKVEWVDLRRIVKIKSPGGKFTATHNMAGELSVYEAIQSGDDGAGSIIDNVFDNDYATKWGVAYSEGNPDGAYGIFDLGSSKAIESMYIAFTKGNERIYEVDIYVSDDNVNYKPIKIAHKSSGTTIQLEEIPLNTKGRFIKLIGKGNSVNYWMNIQEVVFVGK